MAKIKNPASDAHKTKPKTINKRAFERVYWPYIPIVLAISLLLGLGTSTGNLASYVRHPGGRVLAYASSMTISGLLADTNAQRTANGVGPLNLNGKLDAAAQANADDMAARDYWSHYTPEGNPPWIWVTNQGYAYDKMGQNLATGFSDEQSTVTGWMNSPPHRENLLDPDFTDVGFGYANIPDYTAAGGGPMTIVVAFYGKPQVLAANTAPVIKSTPQVSSSAPAAQPVASTPQSTTAPPATVSKPKSEPATTQTSKENLPTPVKQSRIQLALTNTKVESAATGISVLAALAIFGFWVSRHLRALRRYLLKGERYAISHPLTDIALVVIACLLFILSQTAGLIQ